MVDCIQESDGRWRWFEIVPGLNGFRLGRGYVTFATEVEARRDLEAHMQAWHDINGRVCLPLGHIEVLLKAFVQGCPTCGVRWPRPYLQKNDSEGCNWDIADASADRQSVCADALHRDPRELRRVYAVADKR